METVKVATKIKPDAFEAYRAVSAVLAGLGAVREAEGVPYRDFAAEMAGLLGEVLCTVFGAVGSDAARAAMVDRFCRNLPAAVDAARVQLLTGMSREREAN